MSNGRSHRYCYTDYTLTSLVDSPKVRYQCYGVEKCPTTGRLHHQGYVEFVDKYSIKQAQLVLGIGNSNMRVCKGTYSDNVKYCSKDNNFFEKGTPARPGARNDLKEVTDKILAGTSIVDIAMEYPVQYVKFTRGIHALESKISKDINRTSMHVEYYWGLPGTGKSYKAHSENPGAYCALDNRNGWLDGYNGEEVIIFDEFMGLFPRGHILKICDKYPFRSPVKGGFVQVKATKIIFTSNKPPQVYYDGDAAFLRRINVITEFNNVFNGSGL